MTCSVLKIFIQYGQITLRGMNRSKNIPELTILQHPITFPDPYQVSVFFILSGKSPLKVLKKNPNEIRVLFLITLK